MPHLDHDLKTILVKKFDASTFQPREKAKMTAVHGNFAGRFELAEAGGSEDLPRSSMHDPPGDIVALKLCDHNWQRIVSISTDGRVVEWSMKKGLASTTLMVLKRRGNSEGVISRTASGLTFDFPHADHSTYFAGTEEGAIHKCSCSYNEQYLDT